MKNLFILPFDHRASMLRELGVPPGCRLTAREKQRVTRLKQIIFRGFQLALARGAPRDSTAILVDAEFGAGILREAKRLRIKTAMPVEKSETRVFELERNYAALIKKFEPDFVKALVLFNPAPQFDKINAIQLSRLKSLNDFLKKSRREFLLELIVPPTVKQSREAGGRKAFDARLRPKLVVQAMKTLQEHGVKPSVWKLEGVNTVAQAKALVNQARAQPRAGGRNALIVFLGRGESLEKVRKWLAVGARVEGVAGFAVGRTVFAEPLREFVAGRSSERKAVERVAENFLSLLRFWNAKRRRLKRKK